MDNDIRSILITGCSSGIGNTAAHALSKRGYRVFACARKEDDVQRLKNQGLQALQMDMRDSVSIQTTLDTVLEITNGKLYAVFNNAGYGQPGAVEDVSRDCLREQFETNLFGVHELTNLILPVMRKQGYGRIIQHSSVLGFVAMKYRGAYNASKFALEGLTDTLRLELSGTNIFVCLIEPGPIESKFRENAYQAYKMNIKPEGSFHQHAYEAMEKRLLTVGPAVPFTLPADAVVKRVLHALESKRPKSRYPVTFPTYLFAFLKRVLPQRWLDYVVSKV